MWTVICQSYLTLHPQILFLNKIQFTVCFPLQYQNVNFTRQTAWGFVSKAKSKISLIYIQMRGDCVEKK